MISEDSVSRDLFLHKGVVDNNLPQELPKAYLIPNSTVFAVSRDLGTIQATQDPVIWVVGYTTDPITNYTDLSGTLQQRSWFYRIQYSDGGSLVSIHIHQ